VHRGFVTRGDEQQGGAEQLVCAEPVARLFGLHQGREQVVARRQPALGEQAAEVAHEQPDIRKRARNIEGAPRGHSDRQASADQDVEAVAVSRRDPQEPGDDGQRKRQGVVRDEVEGSAGRRGREQVVADPFDLSAKLVDPPR